MYNYTHIIYSLIVSSLFYIYSPLSCATEKKLKKTPIFSTINEIVTFAKEHPEYPDIDNKNWQLPDYTSFYQKNKPSTWQTTLQFLKIKKSGWTAQGFETLLKHVTSWRENNGETGRFVTRIEPQVGSKCIVLGAIYGAFHSIARILEFLHKTDVIDKHLQIIDKNTFLIFSGNVIDLSPYILETLTIALKLIEINPHNVIYLKGSHEEKEAWLNFGLTTELQIKLQGISDEVIPLRTLINRFFQTLPLALYITDSQPGKPIQAVRISYPGRNYPELREARFSPLFENDFEFNSESNSESNETKRKLFNLAEPSSNDKANVEIKAILKAPSDETIPKTGLAVGPPDNGATSFLLFSAPTKTFRASKQFFYDAFAIIDIKSTFADWTISLYNQDVRQNLGIHKAKTYNLSTGYVVSKDIEALTQKIKDLEKLLRQAQDKPCSTKKEPLQAQGTQSSIQKGLEKSKEVQAQNKKIPGVSKSETNIKPQITLSATLDTSGKFADIGNSIRKGLHEVAYNKKEVTFEFLEDEGHNQNITKNIDAIAKKYPIPLIISPFALFSHNTLIDAANAHKNALFLFPIPAFTTHIKNIINFGVPYKEIVTFAITYAQSVEHTKKFAFFYQDELLHDIIKDATKHLEKESYMLMPHTAQTITFEDAANQIKAFNPQTLFLFVPVTAAKNIITAINPRNITDTILIGHNLGDKAFKTFLEKNNIQKQYTGLENFPNPYTSTCPIMKSCRESLGKENINMISVHAYIAGALSVDIINQITGKLTPQAIIDKIKSLKNYNFKGLTLDYSETLNSVSNTIWIDTNQNEWQEKKIGKPQTKAATSTEKKSASVKEHEIVIGSTMDLKGSVRGVGLRTLKAIKASFYLANQAGGIQNKTIKIIAENDFYKPKLAVQNVKNFLTKQHIDILLNPIGGPTTESYIDPYIKNGEVLVLFPSTGAPTLRDPNLKYMIHFRPSYNEIYTESIRYLKENEQVEKIAFVYQDDAASGNSVAQAIKNNSLKKENYLLAPYTRGQKEFKTQAKQITEFDPDVIAFWCPTIVMTTIIQDIGAPNLKNKLLLTVEMGASAVLQYMKKIGLEKNLIDVENGPGSNSDLEIMKEYRKYLKLPDPFLEETWVSTNFFLEILKKIPPPITKEKIITAMENIKDYNFKGFELNFDPKTRTLSNNIWIYKAGKEVAKLSTLRTHDSKPKIQIK